jgi:uncharacterized protein
VRLGIVSDTHGRPHPDLFRHLDGVDHILHAGDVGPLDLLTQLEALAAVTAVWGNTDDFDLRGRIPEVARVDLDGVRVALLHGHQLGTPTPENVVAAYPDADLVVFGHTHRPVIQRMDGVLAVNPGSAGPRRFNLPPTLVLAAVERGRVTPRLVELGA